MTTLPLDTLYDLAFQTRARMTFLCDVAPMLKGEARVRCQAEMVDLFGLLTRIERARMGRL